MIPREFIFYAEGSACAYDLWLDLLSRGFIVVRTRIIDEKTNLIALTALKFPEK